MYKLRRFFAIIILVLGSAMPTAAGPIEDGEAAYHNGDYNAALRLWRPLANRGEAAAQINLGVMYNNGRGVPKDYVRAYMWFSLAAASGDETAEEYRDVIEKSMSQAQIAEAQKLARDWNPSGARGVPAAKRTSRN